MAAKRLQETKNSESFRFLEEKHQFVVTDNETGYRKKVMSSGEVIPIYDLEITGMVDNKSRERNKVQKPDLMYRKPDSLDFRESLYGQPGSKFTGYSQFPRARVNPYFNSRNVIR